MINTLESLCRRPGKRGVIAILLCVVGLLCGLHLYQRHHAVERAIQAIETAGGEVGYGYVATDWFAIAGIAPSLRRLGIDLDGVIYVHLPGDRATVETLEQLGSFNKLQHLILTVGTLDDEECAAIGRLKSLEQLSLYFVELSDDGFTQLSNLKKLRRLDFIGCVGVSNDAIKRLQDSLPDCEIILGAELPNGF